MTIKIVSHISFTYPQSVHSQKLVRIFCYQNNEFIFENIFYLAFVINWQLWFHYSKVLKQNTQLSNHNRYKNKRNFWILDNSVKYFQLCHLITIVSQCIPSSPVYVDTKVYFIFVFPFCFCEEVFPESCNMFSNVSNQFYPKHIKVYWILQYPCER